MKLLAGSLFAVLLSGESLGSLPQRRTALGDFDEFNEIFADASILIPEEYEVSERVGLTNLDMTIKNIKCYDIVVGDVSISNDRNSNQDIDVLVKVMKLDLKCELDYTYDYGWLNGDGWLKLTTDDNSAYTKLRFTSDDFNTQPPKDSSVEECFADIEIADMDFEGDFVSGIIEIFQRLIRGAVERAIGNVACDELGSLGTTLVSGMLELAQEQLEPYRGVLAGAFTDPLFPERNLDLTDGLVALDLKDSKSAVANLFSQALLGADTFMGTLISDSTGATSTGRDLAINIFLRNYFLDDQQAFTLEASQLPMESPVIFKSHDRITETTITLNKVKVLGLDTLSRFNPFIEIGSYTLQNELTWDTLTIDFDVTVDIKPSTFEDAILQDPTSEGISERVSINFAVDNVDVVASLFLLIDAEALGSLELGPLLHTDNFLPCLLSAVHKAELSGLEVDPQDVNEPTLNGFISPGVDRIITDSVEAAFEMYSGVLKRAIPNIFQTSVRDFINDKVISSYMRNTEHTDCPAVEAFEGYLDFRKFFDAETNTYGDLPPMLKNLFDSELLAIDPSTEKPRINDILIGPYTGKQSGIEGNIEFTGDIFGFLSETIPQFGMDFIELRAFDLSAKNVDSLGSPLDLLRPNATDGFLLDNIANFGVGPDPLTFALKGLFALNGDPLLAMHNEVELSVNVADSELFATLMTQVDAKALSSFPLRDIVNPECWLAILAKPMLDDDGNLRDGSDIGLTFESILLSISSVSFDFTCTNCTSPGLQVVSELLRVLEEAGVSDVLEHRFVDLGLDFLKSDYIQAYINRALIEGSLRCPHSLDYVAGDAISDYPVPSFPSLPYKSLESIAFASTVLVQMATVVIAESHSTYDVDANDPLSGEAQLALEPGVRLVDFTSLETSIGAWAGIGVEQLKNYLGAVVDDPKGEDGKDLRINELLRSTFLDDNGLLDIKFNDLSIGGEEMEVSLKHIRVFGLDSILSLNVLEAIGSQTLRNQLKWKKLGVQVVVSLMAPEVNTPLGRSLKTKQDVTLSLELADVDISLALLLALDLDLMGSLQFSSILHIKNILPCLLSAAQAAALTELKVSVGSITSFVIDGFQSSELSAAAAESSRVILEKYGATILSSIPAFFDMTVRAMSNNWISYYLSESTSVGCPISSFEAKSSEFVDFRDLLLSATTSRFFGGSGSAPYGNLFSTAIGFVRDLLFKVDASTGLSAVNDALIAPLTKSQSESTGSLLFPGELLSGGTRVKVGGLDATVQLRARDARIDNLDTVGSPLALLEAVMDEAFELNNTASFGVGDRPLRFAVNFLISLTGDDNIQIRNNVNVSVDLSTANVILGAMVKIAESRFYGFPLRDILDYNCWLAMIPAPDLDARGVRTEGIDATAELQELAVSIANMNLNISCVECSSPRMSELTELLSSPEAQKDIAEVANMILEYITELMGGNFLQVEIDRLLNEAARKCPHSPIYEADAKAVDYDPFESPVNDDATSFLALLGGVALALIACVSVVALIIRCLVRRRHKKWIGGLPPHQVRRLGRQQYKECEIESELNETTRSMFRSPDTPKFVRWIMPLILLANIGFFLSGHLSLGATVNIEAELAGEKFHVEKFFEFSMAKSTVDIWNAGGRALAIMILIFSGIWPYTKQLISLVLWFLPPTSLSVSRRGSILLWLDWLAKWSMIDIFVLVISIAAFRVSVASPDLPILPEDFYSLDMLVVPLWGLYANMIAQLISQVSSHFIIHYHRRIVRGAETVYRQRNGLDAQSEIFNRGEQKSISHGSGIFPTGSEGTECIDWGEALHEHRFGRPHRGETEKLVVRSWINKTLLFVAVSLVALVIIGCTVPSFSLEILGIVGIAVESGQGFEDATTHHSVFTVIKLLMEEARFLDTAGDYIGLGTLSMLLVFSVLLVPIVQSLALLRQWFSPCTRKERARKSIFIEILQAWQYAEVYLIAIFVASWQLGPVSEFMINSYCDSLNETFAQMVYYGILKEEDAQCFRVQSSIEGGSFVLAAGAVLLALLNTFVVKATVQYFRDTDELEENEKEIDEERCLMSDYCSNIEVNGSELNTSERIHPVPVVFTDTFRWLLRRQDDLVRGSQGRIIPEIICESNVCLQQNPTTTPYYRGNVDNSNGGTPKSFKSRKRSETSVCLNAEHPGQDIVLEKELADQPRC